MVRRSRLSNWLVRTRPSRVSLRSWPASLKIDRRGQIAGRVVAVGGEMPATLGGRRNPESNYLSMVCNSGSANRLLSSVGQQDRFGVNLLSTRSQSDGVCTESGCDPEWFRPGLSQFRSQPGVGWNGIAVNSPSIGNGSRPEWACDGSEPEWCGGGLSTKRFLRAASNTSCGAAIPQGGVLLPPIRSRAMGKESELSAALFNEPTGGEARRWAGRSWKPQRENLLPETPPRSRPLGLA